MADPGEKLTAGESMKTCCNYHWRGKMSIIIPLLTLPLLIHGILDESPEFKCLFVVANMAFFWITEAIPLYVTSLLPLILLPLLDIMGSEAVCREYFSDTLVLFLAGLVIALAIEYSNLNKRIALGTILCIGCSPRRLHFGLTLVTTFISLWISNSAATAMMCPIIRAVLMELHANKVFDAYMSNEEEPVEPGDPPHPSRIAMAFYFGICYTATIGGTGTIIGTGTNLTFKGLYDTRFPNSEEKVEFVNFMAYTMPLVTLTNTLLNFLSLQITHMGLFRPNSTTGLQVASGLTQKDLIKKVIQNSYNELGPITCHEIQVILFFAVMIILLFTRNPGFVMGWKDFLNAKKIGSSVCILIVILMAFAMPTQYTFLRYCCGKAPFTGRTMDACLSWSFVHKNTPWGLCFLLGGGFALAEGSNVSGMAKMLGSALSVFKVLPHYLMLGCILALTSFLTMFASNVATCNILIPIYAEMAVAVKIHPLLLTLPAALSISFAYFLPVSTPPNAIICSYANIKTKYLALAGILPTFWGFILLWINALTWGTVIFPGTKEFPEWAKHEKSRLIW